MSAYDDDAIDQIFLFLWECEAEFINLDVQTDWQLRLAFQLKFSNMRYNCVGTNQVRKCKHKLGFTYHWMGCSFCFFFFFFFFSFLNKKITNFMSDVSHVTNYERSRLYKSFSPITTLFFITLCNVLAWTLGGYTVYLVVTVRETKIK